MEFATLATAGLHGDLEETVSWAKRAEEEGFTCLGTADSQGLFRDTYATMALLARETSRIRLSTYVTNPATRHPSVTAGAIATIAEASHGRAVLGIGVGDSALRNIGDPSSSVARLEAYIRAVRDLVGNGSATYDGKRVYMRWRPPSVPILVAGSGPNILQMAGRVADSVVVAGGLTPSYVEESAKYIRAGAQSAGRDPDKIEVWRPVLFNVATSRKAAVQDLLFILATRANHAFRTTLEGKHVPPEYRGPIRELIRRYRPAEHADPNSPGNGALVADLGLTDFLANRFAVAGTPEECAQQFRVLEQAGITRVWLSLHALPSKTGWELMDQFARLVRPLIAQHTS